MATARTETAQARARASRDLDDIESLRKHPAFQRYWERRIVGEMKIKSDVILYDRTKTRDEIWELLAQFRAAYDVALTLLQDEALCRNLSVRSESEED